MIDNSLDIVQSLLKNDKLGLVRGDSPEFAYTRIPFGIPALDKITGGGIPKKRMTLLYGPTNVGKSYLASQIVVNAQKMGGKAVWVDTELSYDKDWMTTCGVDSKKILISQPTTGEEAMEHIREAMIETISVIAQHKATTSIFLSCHCFAFDDLPLMISPVVKCNVSPGPVRTSPSVPSSG